jgi:hypothetical protein
MMYICKLIDIVRDHYYSIQLILEYSYKSAMVYWTIRFSLDIIILFYNNNAYTFKPNFVIIFYLQSNCMQWFCKLYHNGDVTIGCQFTITMHKFTITMHILL